jgi:glycosyltransferase involved in cell wall biosynthesis
VLNDNIRLIGHRSLAVNNPAFYYILNSKHIWSLVDRALKDLNIDVVVHSNILPSAMASTLARRKNVPLIYDYMDHYPQSASAYFKNSLMKTATYNFVKKVTDYAIRKSDVIVTVCKSHAELIKKIAPAKRVYVVPNGVDFEVFKPIDASDMQKFIEKTKVWENALTLLYVGSVDEWLDLETILKVVQRLKINGLFVSLIVVGGSHGGFYIKHIKSMVRLYGLERNVMFTGFVPHRMVPLYINAADVALAPYKIVTKNDGTPLKVLEYLACQKIVLCTRVPEILRRFGNLVYFYECAEDLERLLKLIVADRATFERKLKNARELIGEYSWDVLAEKYYQILRSVTQS